MKNSFRVVSSEAQYGGQSILLEFLEPATECEIKEAVYTLDDCPFGWRLQSGGPGHTLVRVKIHND
jgi:hypothetical protein